MKWKKFGAKAGVRYEHTFMDVEYDYIPERNFKTGFDDVVPTLNLSYMLGTSATLRANYNMRINRPGNMVPESFPRYQQPDFHQLR